MSLFEGDCEVFSIGSYIVDDDWTRPCGCPSLDGLGNPGPIPWQITNCVKGAKRDIAECPDCGATWDDE